MLQKCALEPSRDEDWLFRQSQRIADALGNGEVALAQIYGLRIPVEELDDGLLQRLAKVSLGKAGYDPDEPRIPKGEPHAGEWTSDGSGSGADDGMQPRPQLAQMAVGARMAELLDHMSV